MLFETTWIDLEIIILNEVSQIKRNIIRYPLYVESFKKDTNELIYKTETDSQNRRQIYGYQKGKGVREG